MAAWAGCPEVRDTKRTVLHASPTDAHALLNRLAAPAGSALPMPRVLAVLAHPDDEVLALGARLERFAMSRLITVTDGTPADGGDAQHHGFTGLDAYRTARQEELRCALRHAGLPEQVIADAKLAPGLPVADQTASHTLPALTRAVADAILAFAPEAVLTHPYEGGHPDHDACAFAVHTALRLLSASHPSLPLAVEAPFYHAGEDGSMQTGCFLYEDPGCACQVCELSAEEQARKQARLACFRSQTETLAQFGTTREMFRLAPTYNFTRAPHPGKLFYEQFPWGMSGDRFRALSAEALEKFGLLETAWRTASHNACTA